MRPYYLRMERKKKPNRKAYAVLLGIVSFLVFYFVILAPIRQMESTCTNGVGPVSCPYMLFFAILVSFTLTFCAWHCC